MIELKGKYCRDVVVFNDEVEESAMTLIWDIANSPAFAGSKIRVMPDAHGGKGITSTSVGVGTIDEAPGAYKDPGVITSLIGDTVDIIAFIRPLINLKDKNTAEED